MQRLLDRDLLTAFVMFCIGAIFWVDPGANAKDWIFPRLATYLALGIAVALTAKVIFAAIKKRLPDVVRLAREDRLAHFDVLVFCLIVLAYMFVMYGLGFWLASVLMTSAASLYLTLEKTRRNIKLAVVVPICACIVAYFVFLHVFYVPFPEATWWPGFM